MTETIDMQYMVQAISARGQLIEAHADKEDKVCRVVIELKEHQLDTAMRDAISQLWIDDGFMAQVSRDGLLMIDGLIHAHPQADLVAAVCQQIKAYTMADAQAQAQQDLVGSLNFQAPLNALSASLSSH